MSTHALVTGGPVESLWKGRYVHYDGYPGGVGAALLRIVARDGLVKAHEVLLNAHGGWSTITAERSRLEYDDDGELSIHTYAGESGHWYDSVAGGEFVVGYGNSDKYGYIVTPENLSEHPLCSWAYFLGADGLSFAKLDDSDDGIHWLGKVPWGTRPEDLADIVEVELNLLSA